MIDSRNGSSTRPSSPLPVDFLKMVAEVFRTNFEVGVKELRKFTKGDLSFDVNGAIFADEVVLCVSLLEENQLAATTVYASADFDPRASAPTAQDLLAICVDGIGVVYGQLLDPEEPKRLEQVASESLSAVEDIPFVWTQTNVERRRIYLRVDKANPQLEALADDWLRKHDPNLHELEEMNEEEAEKLFITGPGVPKPTKKARKIH